MANLIISPLKHLERKSTDAIQEQAVSRYPRTPGPGSGFFISADKEKILSGTFRVVFLRPDQHQLIKFLYI